MNLPKLGLSQGFPPELMDESRCTNRGNSYSAKSKNSSKAGSLAISNVSPNVPKRASENMPVTSERPRQRHTSHASQDYRENTVQKVPVYREIEVPQHGCFSSNRMIMERDNGLLDFFCKKRACSNYEPRERPSLLVDFSKQKPLDSIREQSMQIQHSQAASEIESNFQMERSYSTDISQQ